MKNKKYTKMVFSIICIGIILISYLTITAKHKVSQDLLDRSIIISTFSSKSKGDIILYNPEKDKEVMLVKDRDVGITGDISKDGTETTYVDAINDSDQWQVYIKDTGKDRGKKITDTEYGKVGPRFSDGNHIYFLTNDSSGNIKIGSIDLKTKSYSIIGQEDDDKTIDAFDIKDGKIIMSSVNNSLNQGLYEDSDELKPTEHTVYEMDSDGSNLTSITKLNALSIDSISYSSNCRNVIISGEGINGDNGQGIYELSIDDNKITPILNKDILSNIKNGGLSDFANPNLSRISSDDSVIYFTGVSENSEEIEIDGIKCYPTEVFSYDIKSKEIKKVYAPKDPSFIFSILIKD